MAARARSLLATLTMLLAGGHGERLYPLTRDRAKPAVPFAGAYRIIDFTLSNCLNSGLRRVYVLTQYKSLSLERHLRQGWQLLSEEIGEFVAPIPPQMRLGGSWYRGTADAIYQNVYTLERERPERVVVLSGDHVYKMDYARLVDYHEERRADLTVACIEVDPSEARHFGIAGADADGRIRQWHEKPADPTWKPEQDGRCLASMGVYVFDTEVLVRRVSADAKRETEHDFGKNVIPDMIGRDRVYAYPFRDEASGRPPYWRDIGRLDAYYEANLDLVSPDPPFDLHDLRWPVRTAPHRAPPVRTLPGPGGAPPGEIHSSLVAAGTVVSGGRVEGSLVGYDVRVRRGAAASDSILFEGVVLEEGAKVRRAIVDKRVRIPAGEQIGFDLERDAARFTVTEQGVVVVPAGHRF